MKSHHHEKTEATQPSPLWSTGRRDPSDPASAPGTHHCQQHKAKGKNGHSCPTTALQGSTLMRTRGNLYFKDVNTPNQKIISALIWQSLVLSVIHIHCIYPFQFRKFRAVATPETPWQQLLPGLTATVTTTTPCCVWTVGKFKRLRSRTCWQEQTQQLYFFGSESWLLLFHTSGSAALTSSVVCNAGMTIFCISFLPALKAHLLHKSCFCCCLKLR